jgi:hypothetical protein
VLLEEYILCANSVGKQFNFIDDEFCTMQLILLTQLLACLFNRLPYNKCIYEILYYCCVDCCAENSCLYMICILLYGLWMSFVEYCGLMLYYCTVHTILYCCNPIVHLYLLVT